MSPPPHKKLRQRSLQSFFKVTASCSPTPPDDDSDIEVISPNETQGNSRTRSRSPTPTSTSKNSYNPINNRLEDNPEQSELTENSSTSLYVTANSQTETKSVPVDKEDSIRGREDSDRTEFSGTDIDSDQEQTDSKQVENISRSLELFTDSQSSPLTYPDSDSQEVSSHDVSSQEVTQGYTYDDDSLGSYTQTSISSITLGDLPTMDMIEKPRRAQPSTERHSVFVVTPTKKDETPKPVGDVYKDVWDENHVRMPCSSENFYPVVTETEEGEKKELKPRWSIVESALLKPMCSSYDIEESILSYNQRYKNNWNFTNLHRTFTEILNDTERDEFFKTTLPFIVQLTLSLPNLIREPIPLLTHGTSRSLTLSQQQIACLVANSFFCTWPRRNAKHRSSEFGDFPSINFNELFSEARNNRNVAIRHKIRCIIEYFNKVAKSMPTGCVTYERIRFDTLSSDQLSSSTTKLSDSCFTSDKFIEDAEGLVQADFANMRLGGGVLRTGCVQEEIQFTIHPELIISRLFTEKLNDNEVFIMKGAERFCYHTGYGDEFRYSAAYDDILPRDEFGRRYRHIVAMDATRFGNPLVQYERGKLLREVNKAHGAFNCDTEAPNVGVSTGNWGCGAFRGNHRLKAMIQLIAASQCARPLFYSVFGDVKLRDDLQAIHQFLTSRNVTVGTLWDLLCNYEHKIVKSAKRESDIRVDIIDFIKSCIK